MDMTLRQVFSSASNRALFATRGRGALVYMSALALLAAVVMLQDVVPWWVFPITGSTIYIGLLFVGSRWADRDATSEAGRRSAGE